jgi:hypothetical protein
MTRRFLFLVAGYAAPLTRVGSLLFSIYGHHLALPYTQKMLACEGRKGQEGGDRQFRTRRLWEKSIDKGGGIVY